MCQILYGTDRRGAERRRESRLAASMPSGDSERLTSIKSWYLGSSFTFGWDTNKDISQRYARTGVKIDSMFRTMTVQRVGLGFTLPELRPL
jgi:hypothetical protein